MIVVLVAVCMIPTSKVHTQSIGARLAMRCWSAIETPEVYAAAEQCIPAWADSLRSTVAANVVLARKTLGLVGGRAAVDALRADYERVPGLASRRAVILAMGTTGSREDIAFLESQLDGVSRGESLAWYAVYEAAIMLGVLRATSARASLEAALMRNNQPNTSTNHAITAVLASLDHPPCADSVAGNVERELVRIVMECRPLSLSTTRTYNDSLAGGVWRFERDSWRFAPGPLTDPATMPRVTAEAIIAADGRHADAYVSTWCGPRCGEAWAFRLMRTGRVWRVVSALRIGQS